MVAGLAKGGRLQKFVTSKGIGTRALEHAFAQITGASQKSALKAWKRFCSAWGVDWMIKHLDLDETTELLLSYLGFEIGLRGMNPKSIKGVYLSAITKCFTLTGVSNRFSEAISKDTFVSII